MHVALLPYWRVCSHRIFTVSAAARSGRSAVSAIPDTTLVMLWSVRPASAQTVTGAAVM